MEDIKKYWYLLVLMSMPFVYFFYVLLEAFVHVSGRVYFYTGMGYFAFWLVTYIVTERKDNG